MLVVEFRFPLYSGSAIVSLSLAENNTKFRGFPTRMKYLYYRSYLRYTILVGNHRFDLRLLFQGGSIHNCLNRYVRYISMVFKSKQQIKQQQ